MKWFVRFFQTKSLILFGSEVELEKLQLVRPTKDPTKRKLFIYWTVKNQTIHDLLVEG